MQFMVNHKTSPNKAICAPQVETTLCSSQSYLFLSSEAIRHAPSRTDGICRTQHTMLPRIDLPKGTTTPTPDFARLPPACRSSSSRLWPTNSAHDLSLVRVIQDTKFAVSNPKKNKTVRTTIWHLFLICLTADLMDSFIGKSCGLGSWREQLDLGPHG